MSQPATALEIAAVLDPIAHDERNLVDPGSTFWKNRRKRALVNAEHLLGSFTIEWREEP